jgi:hypothetical protein
MRELTYLGRRRVEWRSVAEPALRGAREALVRRVIAADATVISCRYSTA